MKESEIMCRLTAENAELRKLLRPHVTEAEWTVLVSPALAQKAASVLEVRLAALEAENAELKTTANAAVDSLFEQGFSTPVTNAWGKQVDCTKLNKLVELLTRLSASAKAGKNMEQAEKLHAGLA